METAPSKGSHSYSVGDLIMCCDPLVWVLESGAYKTRCAYCFQKSRKLSRCSGCQLHRYCNSACQTADWKIEHKEECGLLKKFGTGACLPSEHGPLGETASGNYAVPTDMIAKLANKIKLKTMMNILGMGQKSAKDLLLMLPANPSQSRVEEELQPTVSAMESRNSLILGLTPAEFLAYYGILRYNLLPIYDMLATPIGLAVYPQAPPGRMTPVCWDINVVLHYRGRRLVMHAVQDIPNYTGLGDLRFNDTRQPFNVPRAERRARFEQRYDYPCTCRRCTEEYEAEINSLRCVTEGCTERIPSDSRAQRACSECGAINSDRLTQFHRFLQQQESIARCPQELHSGMLMALCKEMDAAGILQPDAHIRLVCGVEVPEKYYEENRLEEGWQMVQDLIVCARVTALHKRVLEGVNQLSKPEREKLETLAWQVCHFALEYCEEGMDILTLLFGKKSKEAQRCCAVLEDVVVKILPIKLAFRGSE
ncbi:N-lysine methyltransferase SMYD2-B-like [Paramacrobiotus metropolitanus]|uniref:N-lysine methyltransferase SMYD2-B-like n=1 Tax=Paramacrobiotus metropolitanus TaxID=2943436 RepID=UPI002445F87A|nr:N-lysine methyltransferase SMYD2-B-like [Paramacrobiotus metropolitanus]